MFSYSLFHLVVSLSLAVATDTVKDWKNETETSILGNSPSFSSSCGGALNAAGVISYKQFDTVEPNEVCIWIVRIPGATRYTGSVVKPDSSSTLIISNFGFNPTTTHLIPTSSYNISASVLVITFASSNDTDSGGFYLTFTEGITDGHRPASSTSEDHFLSANSGLIRYPTGKAQYDNYETSIFVFEPSRNKVGQLQKTQVLYIKDELEGTACYDHLNIFTFDRNQAGVSKWKSLGRICGDVDSETITNQDLILIRFHSDGSNVFKGFHLHAQAIF